jgi:hypothetical protein
MLFEGMNKILNMMNTVGLSMQVGNNKNLSLKQVQIILLTLKISLSLHQRPLEQSIIRLAHLPRNFLPPRHDIKINSQQVGVSLYYRRTIVLDGVVK